MGVALMVVPGIAAAYLYVAPRGRLTAIRQLLAGGVAGRGRPGLADPGHPDPGGRPAVDLRHGGQQRLVTDLQLQRRRAAGRADRRPGRRWWRRRERSVRRHHRAYSACSARVWATRRAGCSASPLVAGVGLLVITRLRRNDPRTGWLIAVGGAFATSAVVFSFASGIFHPYYVSFLAPFTAALIGAGVWPGPGRGPAGADPGAAGHRRRRDHRAGRAGQPRRRPVLGQAAGHRRGGGRRGGLRAAALPAHPDGRAGRGARGAVRRARHMGGRDLGPRHQRDVPGRRSGQRHAGRRAGRRPAGFGGRGGFGAAAASPVAAAAAASPGSRSGAGSFGGGAPPAPPGASSRQPERRPACPRPRSERRRSGPKPVRQRLEPQRLGRSLRLRRRYREASPVAAACSAATARR